MGRDIVYEGGAAPVTVTFGDAGIVGLTQADLSLLFGVGVPQISRHATSIMEDGELLPEELFAENAKNSSGPGRPSARYTLEGVIAIGYRVNSSRVATAFRRWATTVLAEYIRTGSVVDEQRLHIDPAARAKLSGAHGRVMANALRQTIFLSLAKCVDYGKFSPQAANGLCAEFTDAILGVVSGMTSRQLIDKRVDSEAPFCGMGNWRGDLPASTDVRAGTSFLTDAERRHYENILQTLTCVDSWMDLSDEPVTVDQWREKVRAMSEPVRTAKPCSDPDPRRKAVNQKADRHWARFVERGGHVSAVADSWEAQRPELPMSPEEARSAPGGYRAPSW